MAYRLEIVSKIPQAGLVHHVDSEGGVWATHHREILELQDGQAFPVACFPLSLPRDLFAFSRPTARAMRSDKSNIYVNRLGNVLGIRGGIVYAVRDNQVEKLFEIAGDCVLHGAICEDDAGNIYFGEYFMNPQRDPAVVWRVSPDLKSWGRAHEIAGIRHVHGVYADPYDPGVLWVTVGDFGGENRLMRTGDQFESLETFGDGSQRWRAVRLFFTPEFVCWLTDSNLEQNHACRLSRSNGLMETGQMINASAWYGCTTVEGLHIAFTTIERGVAIQSDESAVLVSEDAFHWQVVYGFKKDFWRPMQVFKYGVISCPSGAMSQRKLYLSGEGLVGLDGVSVLASIQKE